MITLIRKKAVLIAAILAIVVIVLTLVLYFALKSDSKAIVFKGSVTSNGKQCADIGISILKKDGTVADAAIATLFCEGITNPQSMGLGGGFFATIFIKSTGVVESLIARETAPLAATEDMFVNKTVVGGLAAGVPGEIKGYVELHQKYGRLDWASLIEPTIKLCEEGIPMSPYLAIKLKEIEQTILNEDSLKEVFVDPKTGRVYIEGDNIKRLKLAETLKVIAKEGESAIYGGGSIGRMLVEDIQAFGGIITEEDLKQYKVRWSPAVSTKLQKYTVHSTPLPGSGPVLNLILNLLENHIPNSTEILWHRIIEAFKHAYGLRTRLGDTDFLPNNIKELASRMSEKKFADELYSKILDDRTFNDYAYYGANYSESKDYGTANIAVLGPNGDAITVTSTINHIMGAKRISPQTGIILNDEMDDFSTPGKSNGYGLPASPANFIKPKKMPLSSMTPVIILDEQNNPRLLIGAAGGSKITTSVAQGIIRHLYLGESLDDVVQSPRLHHQLSPMLIQYETDFDQNLLKSFQQKGHDIRMIPPENGFSAVTAISVLGPENTTAVYDRRRPGSVAYH